MITAVHSQRRSALTGALALLALLRGKHAASARGNADPTTCG